MADGPANPNPSRIADASWRFMLALLALEPETQNVGIYADKPGYHNTRNANAANDYSRRHPLDLLGPGDKAAGYDWKHLAAARGDYRSMAKYGARLKAAHAARDPRLYGWREAQGQTDVDSAPEELNFGADGWTTGTPSASHAWHWHLSEHRAFVASWANKECMLSILRGESLVDYLARGGQLMGDDVSWSDKLTAGPDGGGVTYEAGAWLIGTNIGVYRHILPALAALSAMVGKIAEKVDLDPAELETVRAAAEAGAKAGALASAAQLAAAIAAELTMDFGLTEREAEAAAERAVRNVLGGLDRATTA